jgi:hypothetical protein
VSLDNRGIGILTYLYQTVTSWLTVAAMRVRQTWIHTLGIRKILKANMLNSQLKRCDATPHHPVAAFGPTWLERNGCQKRTYMQGVVCDVKTAHCGINPSAPEFCFLILACKM